jgi:hypothetical protein
MDETPAGDELSHLEDAAALGYLLNAFSHELNNHLTNLLLGADQVRISGEMDAVEVMVRQAQKAGEVIGVLQRLGQSNVSRGADRIDLLELSQRLAVWMAASGGGAAQDVVISGDSVEVIANRQNLLRALCSVVGATNGPGSSPLHVSVAVEKAPRSVWAPQGEEIEMAVVRLRRGDPPSELNPEFKELVDGFFDRDRTFAQVRLMAAWEVVRKLRGRLEMYGTDAAGGVEMVLKLPLPSQER